jgi:hypothetical protein
MKTNKWMLIALPVIAMALASCADTDQLYHGDKYIGGDFINNHYDIWDSNLQAVTTAKATYDVHGKTATQESVRFEGSGNKANPSGSGQDGCGDLRAKHVDAVTVDGVQLPWLYNGLDISNPGGDNAGKLADNSLFEKNQFTQNKKLSLIDSSFSYGILSKLYNGQIRCDDWNSYAYLELDETGYGAMFPKELVSSQYFGMVVRGGSNTPYGTGRLSDFDITVNFYKHPYTKGYEKYAFTFPSVRLETNISAEFTALVGFYWSDFNFDPKGIVGLSVTYSVPSDGDFVTAEDPTAARAKYPTYTNMSETHDYYLCLMLYEIMLPDSTWSA